MTGGTPAAAAGTTNGKKQKLADDAVKDEQGRPLCYNFIHKRCTEPCPDNRYHGPETKAMHDKRLIDEAKIAAAKARDSGAESSGSEAGSHKGGKGKGRGAKAKAKAKAAAAAAAEATEE